MQRRIAIEGHHKLMLLRGTVRGVDDGDVGSLCHGVVDGLGRFGMASPIHRFHHQMGSISTDRRLRKCTAPRRNEAQWILAYRHRSMVKREARQPSCGEAQCGPSATARSVEVGHIGPQRHHVHLHAGRGVGSYRLGGVLRRHPYFIQNIESGEHVGGEPFGFPEPQSHGVGVRRP